MTNYTRGRRCEYAARDELSAAGYYVIRSAGSHGPFDLCALPMLGGRARLVQVKRGALRRADVDALLAVIVPAGATAELWQFLPGGRRIVHRRIGADLLPVVERCKG